jgi:hypothetical protein
MMRASMYLECSDEGGGESQLQDSTKVEAIHGGDRIM